eukprot:TRINITY_DN40354_c0_g1_i1.p2 TRINITY_DN40354_c0_g1~~TRINITY_DN40354_c0_g1_i1.p2  ORF type:complete len:121 (-),score=15.73 TRINITY_DN40354_c0_g1_i1:2-364(-)
MICFQLEQNDLLQASEVLPSLSLAEMQILPFLLLDSETRNQPHSALSSAWLELIFLEKNQMDQISMKQARWLDLLPYEQSSSLNKSKEVSVENGLQELSASVDLSSNAGSEQDSRVSSRF